MIHLAFTEEQRNDQGLAQLRQGSIPKPISADQPPYNELIRGIRDGDICRLLAESHNTNAPEAPQKIFERFRAAMEWLEAHALRKSEASVLTLDDLNVMRGWGIHPRAWEKSDRAEVDAASAFILWKNLANNIQLAAERLWRDEFIGFETEEQAKRHFKPRRARGPGKARAGDDAKRMQLVVRTRWAQQLHLLWVEVRLYGIRAAKNFDPFQQQRFDTDEAAKMSSQIKAIIREYSDRLKKSCDELKPVVGVKLFQEDYGDTERLKTLGLLFGPGGTSPQEVGWLRYAGEAKEVLILQCFDHRLNLYRKNRKWFSYLWNTLLKVTTGYGTQPRRFGFVSLGVIAIFSVLYFLNDFFNDGLGHPMSACAQTVLRGHSAPDNVIHYVYLAVVNLTSLGSGSDSYCGGNGTSVLLMASTLTGYFLLATLAALIIQKLTESER